MNAENLRKLFPDIKEHKILNMSYSEKGHYAVLAMLAKKDDTLCLWEISAMSEQEYEHRNRKYRSPKTNRAELKQNLEEASRIWIENITIDGYCFEVSSASGACLSDKWNMEEQLIFLYMMGQGVKLGELEQVSLDRLLINHYELTEKEGQGAAEGVFPNIENADIVLTLSSQHISIPVQKRLRLKTGEYTKPKVIRLTGEAESSVYIHGISFYDVWNDAETRFQDRRYKERFTEKQLEQMKQKYVDTLPQICPKGYVLPLIEYECDKDYQMQFYTTEYLNRVPQHYSSASFFMMHPDKQTGSMGYRSRICQLEAVEKGFDGEIAVELFLCYKIVAKKEKMAPTEIL